MSVASKEVLTKQVERARAEIGAQASKIRTSAVLTLIIGVLVIGGLCGYFYYGYTMFSDAIEPNHMADTVVTVVSDNLPTFRKSLEDEIKKSAPTWAAALSKQIQDGVPMGRQKLEDYAIERTKSSLDQGTVLTHERFETFLRQNKHLLQREAVDLAKDPKAADAAVAELEKSLQLQIGGDLKSQAGELMYVLVSLNEKLHKLAKNQGLDKADQIDRRLGMITRRIQSTKISSADQHGPLSAENSTIGGGGSDSSAPVSAVRSRRDRGPKMVAKPASTGDEAKSAETTAKPEEKTDATPAPVDGPKPDDSKKPVEPKQE
jgi:hypothetical protein